MLTGKPGTGKTSLIKRIAGEFGGNAGGFYTEEIRCEGVRLGFKLVTLDGQEAVLAHTDVKSPYRVSKYGVDVDAFERVGVTALKQAIAQSDLIIIDEIGKMELFSEPFKQAVFAAVNSGKKVLATIMLAPHPWADRIKNLPQVKVVEVTHASREQILTNIKCWLKAGGGS